MKNHSRRTVLALGAGGLLAPGAAAAQTDGLQPIKIMTSLPTLTTAVLFTTIAKRLDRAHGFVLETTMAGGASSLVVEGVLSGSVDFGTPGAPTALQAIRQGADIKVLGATAGDLSAMVISNATLAKLGVPASAPIADRIKALKGLTIGANPIGSTYYQMLRSFLQQYGLNPDNDVRLVAIADSSALLSGIERGRFDAICSASGVVEVAIVRNFATLWYSGARGDIPGSDGILTNLIVARSDMVAKRRRDVDALLAAMTEGLHAVRNDHEQTGRILKEAYFQKLDPAMWDLIWKSATAAYPTTLSFPRKAFDYWVTNDPKGGDSYNGVDYKQIVYGPAQAA